MVPWYCAVSHQCAVETKPTMCQFSLLHCTVEGIVDAIYEIQIDEAKSRFSEVLSKADDDSKFAAAKCLTTEFLHSTDIGSDVWKAGEPYDAVTCMFALHYFFQTEESATKAIQLASENLKEGGHFFGVLPSAQYIQEACRDHITGKLVAQNMKQFVLIPRWKGDPQPFGSGYNFTIKDTVTQVCTKHLQACHAQFWCNCLSQVMALFIPFILIIVIIPYTARSGCEPMSRKYRIQHIYLLFRPQPRVPACLRSPVSFCVLVASAVSPMQGEEDAEGSYEYLVYQSVLADIGRKFDLHPVVDYGPELDEVLDPAQTRKDGKSLFRRFATDIQGLHPSLQIASRVNCAFVFRKGKPGSEQTGKRKREDEVQSDEALRAAAVARKAAAQGKHKEGGENSGAARDTQKKAADAAGKPDSVPGSSLGDEDDMLVGGGLNAAPTEAPKHRVDQKSQYKRSSRFQRAN